MTADFGVCTYCKVHDLADEPATDTDGLCDLCRITTAGCAQ